MNNDLPKFAVNIKRIREEKNLTKTELAKRAEVSRPSISAYEKGTRRPKINVITKIARALNVSPAELDPYGVYENNSYLHTSPTPILKEDTPVYQDQGVQLANWLRTTANPSDRKIILDLAKRLGFKSK